MDFVSPLVEDDRIAVLMETFGDLLYKEEKLLKKIDEAENRKEVRKKYAFHLSKVQKNKQYILDQINGLKNTV